MTQDTERLRVLCDELRLALQRQRKANKRLVEALEGLLGVTNNIEVLGEWHALDVNRSMRAVERAKVDTAISQARDALHHAGGGAP